MSDSSPLLPRHDPDATTSRPHSTTSLSAFPFVDPSAWSTVDDRVRGGSSQSYLERLSCGKESDGRGVALVDSDHGVRFYGTLDIKTLGGAGFASQSYTFPPDAPLAISPTSSAGVRLHFLPSPTSSTTASEKSPCHSPDTLTFILKTAPPPAQRPDGRLEATLSYEAHVVAPLHSGGHIDLPWSSFEPTYRGKPQKDAPALDPRKVKAIGLMCRSDFGAQEGEFEFLLRKVEPFRRSRLAPMAWFDRLRSALVALFNRCRSWIRC